MRDELHVNIKLKTGSLFKSLALASVTIIKCHSSCKCLLVQSSLTIKLKKDLVQALDTNNICICIMCAIFPEASEMKHIKCANSHTINYVSSCMQFLEEHQHIFLIIGFFAFKKSIWFVIGKKSQHSQRVIH